MTLSKTDKLKQELAAAEAADQLLQNTLTELQTLEGCYFKTDFGLVGYSKFRIQNDQIYYTRHYVSAFARPKKLGAEIGCGSSSFEMVHHGMWGLTDKHVAEVTKSVFDAAWQDVVTLAKAKAQTEQNPVENKKTEQKEIDVPFVELTATELSILRDSPYVLPNNRHLLTNGAKEFVAAAIRQERAEEIRVSHLYADCDRQYVEGKHKNWRSLESKFGVKTA